MAGVRFVDYFYEELLGYGSLKRFVAQFIFGKLHKEIIITKAMKQLKIFEDSEPITTVGQLLEQKFNMSKETRPLVYEYLSFYEQSSVEDDTVIVDLEDTTKYYEEVIDEVNQAYEWTYNSYDDLVYVISSGRYISYILEIDPSIDKQQMVNYFINHYVDILSYTHENGRETKDIFVNVYRKYPDLGIKDICREIIKEYYKG